MALHELLHRQLAYPDAPGQQLFVHLGPTVFPLDVGVDNPDAHQQGFVADALVGPRAARFADIFASQALKVGRLRKPFFSDAVALQAISSSVGKYYTRLLANYRYHLECLVFT